MKVELRIDPDYLEVVYQGDNPGGAYVCHPTIGEFTATGSRQSKKRNVFFGDLMMMVGLESLETLNTCRQVCRSWNKMIVSNKIL